MRSFVSAVVWGRAAKALAVLAFLLCACSVERAGRADKPGTLSAEKIAQFEEAIMPHVQEARSKLPKVKQRFQEGLDEGEMLYVVVRLPRSGGGFEQTYVVVKDWQGEDLLGAAPGQSVGLAAAPAGELVSFKEGSILDWVIVKPDGYEEGNFVGRFLEGYRP